MQATAFEYRFRVPIAVFLYLLGFYAPWERYLPNLRSESAWTVAVPLLSRFGIPFGSAVQGITVAVLLLAILGTILRLWGAALRLPRALYLGAWLFHFSLAILMPATGALFVLLAHGLLTVRLVERDARQPRASQPAWGRAILSEIYFVAYLASFVVLAWRYNAFPLERAALLCFGLGLVANAFLPQGNTKAVS
jgi:hypothetical protein